MTVYVFDGTMDGLLSAVFDAFLLKEEPEQLLTGGDVLPMFCERIYKVSTDTEKARRVWTGLEKKLPRDVMRMISTSQLSELPELWQPLFMVNAYYDVTDHWRLQFGAQCKPTGMFHLDATFYGATARAGFSYRF